MGPTSDWEPDSWERYSSHILSILLNTGWRSFWLSLLSHSFIPCTSLIFFACIPALEPLPLIWDVTLLDGLWDAEGVVAGILALPTLGIQPPSIDTTLDIVNVGVLISNSFLFFLAATDPACVRIYRSSLRSGISWCYGVVLALAAWFLVPFIADSLLCMRKKKHTE